MTIDYIFERIDAITEEIKRIKQKKDEKPEFYDTYQKTVKIQRAIEVHSDYNSFPKELFKEKAPNESPAEFEYRKSIYQPVTVPYFHKAINVTGRVWNEQNYDIKWPDGSEKQQDYFYKEYPTWGNLESFFKQVVSPTTCTDPNAVLACMPINLAYTDAGLFDDTKEVTPVAMLFEAKRVWWYEDQELCIIKSYEKSEIEYSGRKKEEGIVLYVFDKNAIYKAIQYGKEIDYAFELELYYEHNMGKLPCRRLGGIPVQDDENFYFQSFFSPSIPALNMVLCDSSTLAMSKYAHAFLQKWEYVDDCDICTNGYEYEKVEGFAEKVQRVCSGCGGTGKKRMFSPLSVYEVKLPTPMASGAPNKNEMNIPPAGYIALDPAILEFLEKQISTNLQRAFELLSIDVMNSEKVSGSETATGKAIDREELYSFLLRFAECVFANLEDTMDTIGRMRYGDNWSSPSIRYPQTFEIRTDAEITEELEKAPEFARRMLTIQYLDARFPIQEAKADRLKLAIKLDPLFGKNETEIAKSVAVGVTPKWKAVLHSEIDYLIDLAIESNSSFMELDLNRQRAIIEQIAKAQVPETVLTPESILNRLS